MPREQKCYRIYPLDEFMRSMESGNNADDIDSVASTYAKTYTGALRTFEQGMHSGKFMLVWDNKFRPIYL